MGRCDSCVRFCCLSLCAAVPAGAQTSRPPLPPDIDAQSTLALAADSQGIARRRKVGASSRRSTARTATRRGSVRLRARCTALRLSEPYDRLNQLLRSANVIGPAVLRRSAPSCRRESSISNTSGPHTSAELGASASRKRSSTSSSTTARRPDCPRRKRPSIEFGRAMLRGRSGPAGAVRQDGVAVRRARARSRSRWSWATMR